jgi:NAD(P)H-hydrate epimerase
MLLVSSEEMRRIDRATIESGHASGETLMERAGAGVVEAMERHYGSPLAMRVLVLCGGGNNGGDGFVAARRLARHGAQVQVALLAERGKLRGEAKTHLERMESAGVTLETPASEAALERLISSRDSWDFALDALLGTGARGAPEGLMAAGVCALGRLRERGTRVIAVDMPTGAEADSGAVPAEAVSADLTVTFGLPKRGQLFYPARAHVGTLEVVDIGLSPAAIEQVAPHVRLAVVPDMAALIPVREPQANKGSLGRVFLVGGSVGLTGAITLSARGALRAGAGYVTVAVPSSVCDIVEAKLTEATKLPLPETPDRTLAADALELILLHAGRADVMVLGPGLSRNAQSLELARRVTAEWERTLVLDADGLTAFQDHREEISHGHAQRILTPHLVEMERLTGIQVAEIEARKLEVAMEHARRWQSVVVLKGPPTVIASPEGEATVSPTGNPALATLGTGDVLSGTIAAFAANGLPPYDAARLGAYVHGMAGDLLTAEKGQAGNVAWDVAETLPLAMLGLTRLRG